MHHLWLDLETTHLDPHLGAIVEVGAIITDVELVVADTYHALVAPPADAAWSPWSREHHAASGLVAELSAGATRTPSEVEAEILAWLAPHDPGGLRLSGYSVHFDRAWLAVHMPRLERTLHHRHHDVSTLVEHYAAVGVERPDLGEVPHRALADCEHALSTARWYRAYTAELVDGAEPVR